MTSQRAWKRATLWLAVVLGAWSGACVLDREGGLGGGGDPAGPATGVGGSLTVGSGGVGGTGGAGGVGGTGGSSTTAAGAGGSVMCDGPEDCAGASCVDPEAGLLMPAETCDGGTCSTETAAPCPNGFKCAGDACLTTCAGSADCVDTHYCNASTSACEPKLTQGAPCPQGDECVATCVDGVCCENACGGVCSSCLGADTGAADGTCAPVTAWSDPDNECTANNELACNGAGACANCGDDVQAPGGGQPAICDSIDANTNTCTIVANAGEFNASNPLNCPQNFHCVIDCAAQDSCRMTTITCPTDYSCTISCPTNDECRDSTIVCPTNGTCDVTCGDDGCEDATIQCGANRCAVDCVANENKPPNIVQGASCELSEDC